MSYHNVQFRREKLKKGEEEKKEKKNSLSFELTSRLGLTLHTPFVYLLQINNPYYEHNKTKCVTESRL